MGGDSLGGRTVYRRAHRDAGRHAECRRLHESSCASASALLPVDSDHRGRLQLAVARAGGMGDDRACAMLRYAVDDVLQSGLSLRRRGDRSARGEGGARGGGARLRLARRRLALSPRENDDDAPGQHVGQSAEEALNSLVEEMKEMLTAPVYDMTPLQDVSEKFWSAMAEARRQNTRREKRLEQSLAKIKAEFLMAREEHEEQLSAERAGAAPAPSPPARASCRSGANLCRG